MPIVYKLINPLTNKPYYVGYTEKSLNERYVTHLTIPKQNTTIELLNIDILPVIEVIVEGININKAAELYWIKELSKDFILENIDGLINYQERKTLFDLPISVRNGIEISNEERYKIALHLLLKEMPLQSSVPIMIRIKNILEWAIKEKSKNATEKAVNGS